MLFSVLTKTMADRFPCRTHLAGADPELTHFTFLTPGSDPECKDCLYVEYAGSACPGIRPAALLTFCGDRAPRKEENVIFVEEKYFTECLNLLTNCFFEEQRREEAFNQLVPVPSDPRSLHEMIDLAAVFLDRSLVLINLSFHVIAASKTVPVTDPIWIQNIARGYCTYEFIRVINQLLPDNAMTGDTAPFFVNCSSSPENKLCCYIYYENQPIGYLILLDSEKGILPYHMQYLPRISQLISATLRNLPDFQALFLNRTESFFRKLLEGELPNSEREEDIRTNLKLPDSMRCLLFLLKNRSRHDLFYLQRELRPIFPLGFLFPYEENLVAVVSNQNYDKLFCEPYPDCLKIVDKVGVSLSFQNIQELPRQFAYARTACRIFPSPEHRSFVCRYEEIQFLHILSECRDPSLLRDFLHPALETLHVYDLAHDTSLLETLRCYLACGMRVKETAAALFLHRNTLNYRLHKIRELTGLDLEEAETAFRLHCSFEINRLLNLY